jgi:predicted GNAT family acetyltransferase
MPSSTDELTITRNDAEGRYEIRVGDVLAGFTEFEVDSRGRLILPHTEIDPAFKGRGLATILVRAALEDIVARGETIVPLCPFVRRYLRENDVPGLLIEGSFAAERAASRAPQESGSGGGGV